MSGKYLIFGATGNIGSNLADQLYKSNQEVHLVGRNKEEIKSLSEKFKCTYSVADVLENNFVDKIKSEIQEVKGIAYCVGSIDLKPFKKVKEDDLHKCMKLNLYSAIFLAVFSLSTTTKSSPAKGLESKPTTSTGCDGSASFMFSPRSLINTFTFPHSDPETKILPTFNVPF